VIEVDPADERRHEPGPEPDWSEAWSFDFATADGSLGGYVELCLHPRRGVAWYWAALAGPGRSFVTVVDHDAPMPRPAGSLELRAEGLWADHTCETALDHWSLGNEAFAVGLDHPSEAYGRMLGERVPLGFDLEWETDGRAVGSVVPAGKPGPAGTYEVPCRVHGEVLVGVDRIDLDGYGQRSHRWGVPGRCADRWTERWCRAVGRLDDGTRFGARVGAGPAGAPAASGYVIDTGGVLTSVEPKAPRERFGAGGLPLWSQIELGPDGPVVEVRPLAAAPVLVGGAERPLSRLPRALCRFVAGDGRAGVGWTEWNQPLPSSRP